MASKLKFSSPDEPFAPLSAEAGRLPPLKALHAFEATARLGSFALGAQALGVTPSAVSHQIQQLEAFLGVQLFARYAGRSSLTAAGGAYAREVTSSFRRIARATEIVAPQSQMGTLAVGCSPGFAAKWIQPRLSGFLEAHPNIGLRLTTLSDMRELGSSRCDIAIFYGRPDDVHSGVAKPLLTEQLMPLCSPALRVSAGLDELEDLSRATLIHSANGLTWAEYFGRVGKPGIRAGRDLWLDRSTIAIQAAVDGLGVILESDILTQQELRDRKLVPLFEGLYPVMETSSYFLHYPLGSGKKHLARRFEAWLQRELDG